MTGRDRVKGASFEGQRPSFTALPNWLAGKASALELAVLWSLQFHYPDVRPSITRLAQVTGLSRRQVFRVVEGLERKGWLVRAHAFSESGRKLANHYELRIWDEQAAAAESRWPSAANRSGTSDCESPVAGDGACESPTASDCVALVTESHHPRGGGLVTHRHGDGDCVAHKEEQEKKKETSKGLPVYLQDQYLLRQGGESARPEPAAAPPDGGAPAPVPSPAGAGTDRAGQGQPRSGPALPPCAEAHRGLVVAWWLARKRRHPSAPNQLSAADLTAIEFASEQGVLPQFLAEAEARALKSLGHQYRATVARLLAGPGVSAEFDQFREAYLAIPINDRAHGQSVTEARDAFLAITRGGIEPSEVVRALRAAIRDHGRVKAKGDWVAPFPDMLRWLQQGRYAGHLSQGPHGGGAAVPAGGIPPRPERSDYSDPEAHGEAVRRWNCLVMGLDPGTGRHASQTTSHGATR